MPDPKNEEIRQAFIGELKELFLRKFQETEDSWRKRSSSALEIFEWLKTHLPWTEEEKKIVFHKPMPGEIQLSQEEKRKRRRWFKLWGK